MEKAIELIEWSATQSGRTLFSEQDLDRTLKDLRSFYVNLEKPEPTNPEKRRLLKNWKDLEPKFIRIKDITVENPWYNAVVYELLQVSAHSTKISAEESEMRLAMSFYWRQSKNTGKPIEASKAQTEWFQKNIVSYASRAKMQMSVADRTSLPEFNFGTLIDMSKLRRILFVGFFITMSLVTILLVMAIISSQKVDTVEEKRKERRRRQRGELPSQAVQRVESEKALVDQPVSAPKVTPKVPPKVVPMVGKAFVFKPQAANEQGLEASKVTDTKRL